MATISLDELQHDLTGYLHRVAAGETLLIVQAGQPLAEIKPAAVHRGEPRPFGLCAGEFTTPDDFDAPLPDAILRQFEGA